MEELKKCPFCGSENVDGFTKKSSNRIINYYFVECEKCGCSSKAFSDFRMSKDTAMGKAKECWNRRANDGQA